MTLSAPFTALGNFIHAPARGQLDIIRGRLVTVDAEGAIKSVTRCDDPGYDQLKLHDQKSGRLIEGEPEMLFLPGMVDLHIHAPQ